MPKVKVSQSRDQSEPFWPNALPVSLESGGGIPCWPNQTATLLVMIMIVLCVFIYHVVVNIITIVHIS